MSLLELENVVVAHGKVEALKGVTLRVEQGEIVVLLGSNGAGKSTTLRTISGLIHPLAGTMRFLDQPIDRLSPEAIVKLGVSHVPERRRVFPGLTVRENILLGGSSRVEASRRELETDVDQMFAVFPELKPFANVLGWKLSGGQQQMLAIARGLMSAPRLLMLDEPSLGLAPALVTQVFEAIVAIAKSGVAVCIVEQDVHLTLEVAAYAYVLENGAVTAQGPANVLLHSDQIRTSYLGL